MKISAPTTLIIRLKLISNGCMTSLPAMPQRRTRPAPQLIKSKMDVYPHKHFGIISPINARVTTATNMAAEERVYYHKAQNTMHLHFKPSFLYSPHPSPPTLNSAA
jgi:hypothetical protein